MMPLGVLQWAIDLMIKAVKVVLGPAMEWVMTRLFEPILQAVASAVGTLMSTIATFWVYVPTVDVGSVDAAGRPTNGTISWVWEHTQFIALFIAAIGLIAGAVQMAWTQRGESARELLRALITLAVAAAFSIAVAQVLIKVGDVFSACIISTALKSGNSDGWFAGCQNIGSGDAAAFGTTMTGILGLAAGSAILGSPLLLGILIAVGILCILASIIQIVLMVVRTAMLILLLGVLPIAAAATNTEMGRNWFKKIIAWLLAFILYKPVAAIIYATAIRLVSNNGDPLHFDISDPKNVGSVVMNVITGLTMLILALFAMPALMRFIVPMVGATAGGAGAGMLAAKMVGADKVGDMVSKGAEQGADDGGGGGGGGPTGAQNVGRASQQAPSGGGGGGAGGAEGAAAGGEASGAAGAAGGAGGAAAGGGGAAAGGAGAAAGGAAATGVGIPVAIAIAAYEGGKAVAGAAKDVGNEAMGDGGESGADSMGDGGGGPTGSGGGGDLSRERDQAPRDFRDDDRDNYQPPPDGPSGSS
jgi:hypothetical protein